MLQENKRVRDKIPPAFEPLMGPHIAKVDQAIEAGLTKITWTSINIEEYIQNVHNCLGEFAEDTLAPYFHTTYYVSLMTN